MARLTKAMRIRLNGHRLGEYDSFMRHGEIIVGQLCQIDVNTGHGLYIGFVLNDTLGQKREGSERQWKVDLRSKDVPKVTEAYIAAYERHVTGLND